MPLGSDSSDTSSLEEEATARPWEAKAKQQEHDEQEQQEARPRPLLTEGRAGLQMCHTFRFPGSQEHTFCGF